MKLTTFLILISVFCVFATETYSQGKTLDLNMGKTTVKEVLSKIEDQSDFKFMYSGNVVDVNRDVSINFKNAKIDAVLKILFAGTDIEYVLKDRFVILTKSVSNNELPIQQLGNTITGKVTDSSGSAIPGVSVVVRGTTIGTITDSNGNYSLPNISDKAVLKFSFVGMQMQEIAVAGKTTINVMLADENIGIDEVVAIGYGTVKKSNLTGSVSKMTDQGIMDRPIAAIGEAFQGQLAGVRAQAQSGRPGDDLTIRIRGVNSINGDSSPLFVIDGVPRPNMSDLNPDDIASIQILKDASSTAIYGARGGNGVILIETKRGKGKPAVSFESYYGYSQPEKYLPVMNGSEWVAYNMYRRNLSYLQAGGSMSDPMTMRPVGQQIPADWATRTEFTDWQRAVLQNAPIQNYSVSASSKGEMGDIYFSAGYLDQQGIIVFTGSKKANTRLNASMNISKDLRVGVNFAASTNHVFGENPNTKERPFHHALAQPPLVGLNENTVSTGFSAAGGYPNPYIRLKLTLDDRVDTRVSNSFWGEYDIMKGLTFKSQYSINYDAADYQYFVSADYGYNTATKGTSFSEKTNDWTIQNTLTYAKSINDHNINVLVGQAAEQEKYFRIDAQASGYPYDNIQTLNVATTPSRAWTQRKTYSNASYFGRASYNYKEKYLLEASVRRDGSSRFGSNTKWGIFPAFSAGWKLNEEGFMAGISWVNLLKPRISYGTSGNDRIGDYQYEALLGTYTTSWNDTKVSGVAPSNIANPDLKWESTKSMDYGFDFTGFNNRIQFNFDYYVNKTEDLLFNVTTPNTTGFDSYLTNLGAVQNKGWEIDITTHNLTGKFNWTTNLNLSRNRNKVLDMGAVDQIITLETYGARYITKVGGPISQFYAYETNGFLLPSDFDATGKALVPIMAGQLEGDMKYVDQNDDKIINTNDYKALGNNLPDLIYGMTNRFSYKNFDLSVLLQGQLGGQILFEGARQIDTAFRHWLQSYKPDYNALYGVRGNPIPTDYIAAHGLDMTWDGWTPNVVGTNDQNDDRRIYSTTFLRIKNVTLSYTLPKSVLQRTVLSSVRGYISLDNLKTFTDYPGYTPESNSFGNNTNRMGTDYVTYPLSRRAIVGVVVTF